MPNEQRTEGTLHRAESLLQINRTAVSRETDRLFLGLLIAEWLIGIVVALTLSPLAWEGNESSLHPHVLGAFVTGAVLVSLPLYLALRHPGDALTRHVLVAAQALMTGHFIHLSGGRIETHFLYFGSLAFVSFYRDWRVILNYAAIAGVYHYVGGLLIPFSVYGLHTSVEWRWAEHAGWLLFEAAFLIVACVRWQKEMANVALRQARLELINEGIENEILVPLRDSAEALAGSAGHLVGQMTAQRTSVLHQSSALQQAHVTATEIRHTAQAATRLASSALAMANDADTRGQAGERALSASLSDFGAIQDRVRDIATEIRELQEKTRLVGSITGTVRDLADRSNMLALNAAIEAVRSGEHGKGFAIVAREMRSLADQSLRSTGEVRGLLESMDDAVRSTADSGDIGAVAIEQGLTQVRASSDSLRQLAEAMGFMSQSVRQISSTVSEQSVGVDEIFVVITRLQEVMEEAQDRLDATDRAVAVVERSADAVRAVVKAAGKYSSSAA